MGKRKKSTRTPAKKLVLKLDTKFNCLFCNHDKSVSCTLDKKNSIGSLQCKICGQSFQTRINSLSQAVDVYSDWFDAVEEVNSGRGSESEDEDDDSASDYESDSDAETKKRPAVVDSDEEEFDEEETGGPRRTARAVMDSDEDDF